MASAKWVSPECIKFEGRINPDYFSNISKKVKVEYCKVNISEIRCFQSSCLSGILTTNIFAVLKGKHFPV